MKSVVFFVVAMCRSGKTRRFERTFASVFKVEDFANQETNRSLLAQAASPNNTALQSVLFIYNYVHVSSRECSTES
jgi:hypothetical protein